MISWWLVHLCETCNMEHFMPQPCASGTDACNIANLSGSIVGDSKRFQQVAIKIGTFQSVQVFVRLNVVDTPDNPFLQRLAGLSKLHGQNGSHYFQFLAKLQPLCNFPWLEMLHGRHMAESNEEGRQNWLVSKGFCWLILYMDKAFSLAWSSLVLPRLPGQLLLDDWTPLWWASITVWLVASSI